jgi:hypothetical protein
MACSSSSPIEDGGTGWQRPAMPVPGLGLANQNPLSWPHVHTWPLVPASGGGGCGGDGGCRGRKVAASAHMWWRRRMEVVGKAGVAENVAARRSHGGGQG